MSCIYQGWVGSTLFYLYRRKNNVDFVFIYITHPSPEDAKKTAEYLLKKKLIACVNMYPIESMYWWNGKIENDRETVTIAKTIGIVTSSRGGTKHLWE